MKLCTVNDRTPDIRVFLSDCVDWAAKDFEWELAFLEWTNEGSESELLIDVYLDIILEQ